MNNEILKEFGADPISLLKQWLEEAEKSELNDPEAVNLATADKSGRPSNRMVLLKEISERGLKFHTNELSQKGREISQNPYGSMCLYWKSTRKQIRAAGKILQVSENEADEYFATRNIERQIGAWASKQSSSFERRSEMEAAIQKYEQEFAGMENIPRPPYWKGYLLVPDSLEFWIAHKDRLHTRFKYERDSDGWRVFWLCP